MAKLEMAEYYANRRGAAKTNVLHKLLDRDRKSCENDYTTLLDSLSYRIDTLGIRSPTRLCSNAFWDEYLKTERQRKIEKKRAESTAAFMKMNEQSGLKNKMAPAATNLTGIDTESETSDSEARADSPGSGDDSDGEKPRRARLVAPASAPAGGRKETSVNIPEKPTTANPSRRGGTKADYSPDDPEFDDENKRRLRQNAMSVISGDMPDSKRKSHPFIKKMLLAKMEPPKTLSDTNSEALKKKKAEKAAREKKEKEKQQLDVDLSNISSSNRFEVLEKQQLQLQMQAQEKEQGKDKLRSGRPALSRARSMMAEEFRKREQAQIVNPLFLDEKKGQELYRILIQQEIKWTRQAVSESSRRNRLSAKREFAFFQ